LDLQPCNDNTDHAKAEQQGLLYDINPVTLTSSTAPKNINVVQIVIAAAARFCQHERLPELVAQRLTVDAARLPWTHMPWCTCFKLIY
jgi:hypothetical protein